MIEKHFYVKRDKDSFESLVVALFNPKDKEYRVVFTESEFISFLKYHGFIVKKKVYR